MAHEKEKTEVKQNLGRIMTGRVASTKMKDTVVVVVERYVKHPKYKKFLLLRKRYKAHDAGNVCKVGDTVSMQETRPISKDKHFIVVDRIAVAPDMSLEETS
jgi:small subunit ribosomal protein S17